MKRVIAIRGVTPPSMEFGSMKRVTLFREGKQQKINLETLEGKGVVTQPHDTIEVPQKGPFGG